MIQTETSKAKILFVKITEDAQDFLIEKNELSYWGDFDWQEVNLPNSNWQILNTLKDVSEEEAEMIAEIDPEIDFEDAHTKKRYPAYVDHVDIPTFYTSPARSLRSLAQSLNLDTQKNYVILYEEK